MAQQEHDAQKGKDQKPLVPTDANAPDMAKEIEKKANDIKDNIINPDSEIVNEPIASDLDSTMQATPILSTQNDDLAETEVTQTLEEMTDETPVSISDMEVEETALRDQAFDLAEAAADHENALKSKSGNSSLQEKETTTGLSEEESGDETPVSISDIEVVEPMLLNKAYELAEAASDHTIEDSTISIIVPDAMVVVPETVQTKTEEIAEELKSSGSEVTGEIAGMPDALPITPTQVENTISDDTEDDDTTHESEDEEDTDDGDDTEDVDYGQLSKVELIGLLEKEIEELSAANVSPGRFKKSDGLVKEIRPVLDQLKRSEYDHAYTKYVADTGTEEGFEYKHDEKTRRIEEHIKELKRKKKDFFQHLEKSKDQNFTLKTELLQRLRELVDTDESHETGAADMKSSWEEFKKIQEEWKQAGNVSSPHNGTLWATYNALIDRYFSNRNIYFELKELDRKRNSELKIELCEKIENLVATLENRPMSREILSEGNQIFEDYKHVGPAPREEQEALWQRFKKSLDTLYDARRSQYDDQKKSMVDIYEKKSKIYEAIVPYTTFSSGSINEWNTKTREIIAYQEAWVATKGPMPREEGKQLSKKFWAALKTFFSNKGEFFKQLESRREVNLKAKTELCEEVGKIVESGEDSAANTQRVIELQKKWKTIGQVPEKFKDSIYQRFKKTCDAYFEQKRSKNKDQEKGFEENLALKLDLCTRIEKAAADPKDSTISHLNDFKEEWSKIGFVPRKDMQPIQKRYIAAINDYVSAIGKLTKGEKEQVVLESEVELVKGGETNRGLYRKESDIRRKVIQLENDISLWQNNIEFFAKSKTSDKLKANFEEKIRKASEQLEDLKHQLTIIQEAI